ncbi:hypothetical protein C8J57DRAFT_1273418 [Mycena rebaudengoi]|nr:hypothetical protein C8J57DRAFT_1273418 [Mycena rebaudengoi]
MFFKAFCVFSALALAIAAPVPEAGDVFTVTRIYHTFTDRPPYIIDATTTMTFTASPTTTIQFPTGPGEPGP